MGARLGLGKLAGVHPAPHPVWVEHYIGESRPRHGSSSASPTTTRWPTCCCSCCLGWWWWRWGGARPTIPPQTSPPSPRGTGSTGTGDPSIIQLDPTTKQSEVRWKMGFWSAWFPLGSDVSWNVGLSRSIYRGPNDYDKDLPLSKKVCGLPKHCKSAARCQFFWQIDCFCMTVYISAILQLTRITMWICFLLL